MSVFKEFVAALKAGGEYVEPEYVAEQLGGTLVNTRWEPGGRWYNLEYKTFKFAENKFFEVRKEIGDTEYQDDGSISVYKVKPRTVEIIKYDRDAIIAAEEWSLA